MGIYNHKTTNHPVRVQFSDGSCTEYVYAADGRKLREIHITVVEGLSVNMGQKLELTPAQTMAADTMDYADNLRYRRQHRDSTHDAFNLDYHFDGGYLSVTPTTSGSSYNKTLHFFICDHQGNIRIVVDGSDNIKQTNEYFPYGGPWGGSTDQGFQPYKYNGKELDRVHGLDWYDYGARRYDPAYCMFTQMDPLAEKYPHLNPYVYCAGNPVRYVDPDGRHIRVTKKDGVYNIEGGEVDDDLNIYDVTYGWGNRVSIGKALTQYSFFDDNGNPVIGSIINLNDKSGQWFWDDFSTWASVMPMIYYVFNAYGGQKYDFKRQGEPYPKAKKYEKEKINANHKYHNRGLKLNVEGKDYIASGRDIGNYAAGYYAGSHGLTWQESRRGFDALESIQKRRFAAEKAPSQSAQLKGYTNGWAKIGLIRRLLLLKLFLP